MLCVPLKEAIPFNLKLLNLLFDLKRSVRLLSMLTCSIKPLNLAGIGGSVLQLPAAELTHFHFRFLLTFALLLIELDSNQRYIVHILLLYLLAIYQLYDFGSRCAVGLVS